MDVSEHVYLPLDLLCWCLGGDDPHDGAHNLRPVFVIVRSFDRKLSLRLCLLQGLFCVVISREVKHKAYPFKPGLRLRIRAIPKTEHSGPFSDRFLVLDLVRDIRDKSNAWLCD